MNSLFFESEIVCSKLNYFWRYRPNSSMEGVEGGIFSKVPDWKPLFLLKIKLTKAQDPQIRKIMQTSSTGIRFLGLIPELKKSALMHWSMIMKMLLDIGENPSKVRCGWTILICCNYVWEVSQSVPLQKSFNIFTLI